MAEKRPTRVGVYIGTEQKGFLIALGLVLSRRCDVQFIARNRDIRKVILRHAPELSEKIVVVDDLQPTVDPQDVVKESLEREKKYGEFFTMLMSYDRALGQGYLFNADRHPHIYRSEWPHEAKLKSMLEQFLTFEQVFERCSSDIILGHDRPIVFDIIARKNGAMYLTLGSARYGNRYIWFEDRFEGKSAFFDGVDRCLGDSRLLEEAITYEQYGQYKETSKSLDYSYPKAVRQAAMIFLRQTYIRLRGIKKKDSYVFCGWVPPVLRSPANYRYFQKNGVKPEDLGRYKVVYFPLHQEPESALLFISPEFNNSMEIAAWVSKSLPCDTILVLKENPWAFGVRSRRYYRTLKKISNVFLAHPGISSEEWVRRSSLVVTITGTIGYEAVYFHRPVLSYGSHQLINRLPTVRYSNNVFSTSEHVADLLALDPQDKVFEKSKHALHKSLMEASFDMPGYEKLYSSGDLHLEQAKLAAERLAQEYPSLFS